MNKLLWPFPVFCGSGKPLGDGIYWPTNRGEDTARSQHGASASGEANRRQNQNINAAQNANNAAFTQSKSVTYLLRI